MVTSERRQDKMAANAVKKEKYVQFLPGCLKFAEFSCGSKLSTEVHLSRVLTIEILVKPTVYRPASAVGHRSIESTALV